MADIFDGNTDDQDVDPNKDYFEELVGEGKKFEDAKALARAKYESDRHIAQIEAENRQLREAGQQNKTIEEFLAELNSRQRQDGDNQPPKNVPENADNISAEKIEELISQKMTEKQKKDQREANQIWVKQQLQQLHGEDYSRRVLTVANDLGMSKEEMSILAAEKPKAFMKLIGDNTRGNPQPTGAPPSNRYNTETGNLPSGAKNWGYYNKLKQRDPKLYNSARVQGEMHREAIKQGAAFFD